jgi:PPOX class probable F420-dependent enzyme
MDLSDTQRAFLEKNHGAAMVTLRSDGTPHAVRVGIALVDGKIWSSGVPGRVRTRYLQRDPRATLMVFEQGFGYLTIEARVRILEHAVEDSVRLFSVMQNAAPDADTLMWNGKPLTLDAFREAMRTEQRLIYEFDPQRIYGMY